MAEIEVRLLFPNLGRQRGEVVAMDDAEAERWFQRRLAEPVTATEVAEATDFPRSPDPR